MPKNWTTPEILDLARSYQEPAVLSAAADLEIFDALAAGPSDAGALATRLQCDPRGLTILLDALAALELVEKSGERYSVRPEVAATLARGGKHSILAVAQHQANCLRRWALLASAVQRGHPAGAPPSVRGRSADHGAFIGAMHELSARFADEVIRAIQPLEFRHLLDVGGASGTWTMAFLRACPTGRATLFDLPEVIPMAQRRLAAEGLAERVRIASGNFLTDPMPDGADLAWVSAIVHQNSRAENRRLFTATFRALAPGGRIAIRDIVMDDSRTRPVGGALFAVNMLVATEGGGTFTLAELRADLEAAGFAAVSLVRQDEWMNSIVSAQKPTDQAVPLQ